MAARITVPSFWVRYSGAAIPLAAQRAAKARVVRRARSTRQALSRVAFSRSRRPMRPSSWEQRDRDAGALLPDDRRRLVLAGRVQGREHRGDRHRARARGRGSAAPPRACPPSSKGTMGRPSYSWPPSSMTTSPRTIAARSSGQSTNGGSEALAGSPIRTAATRARSRRWTTRVREMRGADHHRVDRRAVEARALDEAGEGGGDAGGDVGGRGRLHRVQRRGRRPAATASVLVPPTSMPMRSRVTRTPRRSRGRSRRRAGRHARAPSG